MSDFSEADLLSVYTLRTWFAWSHRPTEFTYSGNDIRCNNAKVHQSGQRNERRRGKNLIWFPYWGVISGVLLTNSLICLVLQSLPLCFELFLSLLFTQCYLNPRKRGNFHSSLASHTISHVFSTVQTFRKAWLPNAINYKHFPESFLPVFFLSPFFLWFLFPKYVKLRLLQN